MLCKWLLANGSLQIVIRKLQPANGYLQPAAYRPLHEESCLFQILEEDIRLKMPLLTESNK